LLVSLPDLQRSEMGLFQMQEFFRIEKEMQEFFRTDKEMQEFFITD